MNDDIKDDDDSVLTEADHQLGWMGDDIETRIRNRVESMMRTQEPTTKLLQLRLYGEPAFLTGGYPHPDKPKKMRMTRAGFAVPFEIHALVRSNLYNFHGVLSWVALHPDNKTPDNVFLEQDATLESATEMLKKRIFEIEYRMKERPKGRSEMVVSSPISKNRE